MKDNSFYFQWKSFLIGFFLGFFGVLWSLFATVDRRDKVYSSIMGAGIAFILIFLMRRYGGMEDFLKR
jgi:hypothetical protein